MKWEMIDWVASRLDLRLKIYNRSIFSLRSNRGSDLTSDNHLKNSHVTSDNPKKLPCAMICASVYFIYLNPSYIPFGLVRFFLALKINVSRTNEALIIDKFLVNIFKVTVSDLPCWPFTDQFKNIFIQVKFWCIEQTVYIIIF